MDINHNLVKDLKILDLWEEVKEQIIENRGDISTIESIPQHIRDVYKTSFTNSPYAYIEVAARAQKWFDQSISRNIYLETRDIDETMQLYTTAWEKGLKSTYYLHMKEVTLKNGRRQTIYFFARDVRDGALNEVPAGYQVVETERTGMPVLKKA